MVIIILLCDLTFFKENQRKRQKIYTKIDTNFILILCKIKYEFILKWHFIIRNHNIINILTNLGVKFIGPPSNKDAKKFCICTTHKSWFMNYDTFNLFEWNENKAKVKKDLKKIMLTICKNKFTNI